MTVGTKYSNAGLSTTTRYTVDPLRHHLLLRPLALLQLLDAIEDEVKQGGCIIDWHACDLFPQSWIDLVVVLRTDSTRLYDRLKARGYAEAKLQENLDSEIMEVLLSEARESYDAEIVVELQSGEADDIEENVERIESWIGNWKQHQPETSE